MSNSSTPTEENGNKNIAVEQLANGFLNLYENDVIRVKRNLQEILYDFGVIAMAMLVELIWVFICRVKQGKMSEDLHELNNNYAAESLVAPQALVREWKRPFARSGFNTNCSCFQFDKVKIYKDKLHAIKKQMNSIHQRSKAVKVSDLMNRVEFVINSLTSALQLFQFNLSRRNVLKACKNSVPKSTAIESRNSSKKNR